MVTIKHYCLDSGQVQIVLILENVLEAVELCEHFNEEDHGTDSVWYVVDEVL